MGLLEFRGTPLNDMHKVRVATKMSWISRRQMKQEGKIFMARYLLGLFDVNMSPAIPSSVELNVKGTITSGLSSL